MQCMNTITEIESAIERLPEPEVAELAAWLERHRQQRGAQPPAAEWLDRVRGAARPGVTTDDVMAWTRAE
jgi:cytochrome c553